MSFSGLRVRYSLFLALWLLAPSCLPPCTCRYSHLVIDTVRSLLARYCRQLYDELWGKVGVFSGIKGANRGVPEPQFYSEPGYGFRLEQTRLRDFHLTGIYRQCSQEARPAYRRDRGNLFVNFGRIWPTGGCNRRCQRLLRLNSPFAALSTNHYGSID